MNFASDNWAGASPKVMAAIQPLAGAFHPAYGGDEVTKAVETRFADLFEREVAVFPVTTGTMANALAISAFGGPGGVVLCHEEAHIAVDEAGAVPFFGGGLSLAPMAGAHGRIAPETLRATLARFPEGTVRHGRPLVLSLSELTEWGAAYRPDEVAALSSIAHARGLAVHMDGARFANAVASLGVAPADLTWRAGVDVMSFGGTKNGCLMAEAVVFFDPKKTRDHAFAAARQRAGQGVSKGWFIAAQLGALLEGGHWLELAGHANRMAGRLADALEAAAGVELVLAPEGNQVFARVSPDIEKRLTQAGVLFHAWPSADGTRIARFVASFLTSEADIAGLAAALG